MNLGLDFFACIVYNDNKSIVPFFDFLMMELDKMRKRTFITLILALSLCLCVFPVAAEDGVDTASFMVGDRKVSTATIEDGSVTLVDAPATVAGFCGWMATIGDKTVFLPAGGTCAGLSGDVVFSAVTADFVTDTGCSVYLREGKIGLRFTSTIKNADYETLAMLAGGKDHISFGTYIVPARYITDTHGSFTLEELLEIGHKTYIDVPASDFYSTTSTTSTIAGSVTNILKGNYTMEYTGVGYMKITYTDGSHGKVYASYNQIDNSRSILKTVLSAYNDRDESYKNLVLEDIGSTHSPYTPAELAVMREFLDQVVLVGHDMSYKYFVLPTGYYVSPWKITYSSDEYGRNMIYAEPPKSMTASDVMGVYLDGLVIALRRTKVQNGRLVFEHDSYVSVG